MMKSHRLEMLAWPFISMLGFERQLKAYDKGRKMMHDELATLDCPVYEPPKELGRKFWNIPFRSQMMTAAGLDKHCEFYSTMAKLGAGSHIVGTTTKKPRDGFLYEGVRAPWLPLRNSGAALNKMGLPNISHAGIARMVKDLPKLARMPLWTSIAADPDAMPDEKPHGVLEGIQAYIRAGADVIEINESCPNTGEAAVTLGGLEDRLRDYSTLHYVCPLVIKLSNDTAPEHVPRIVKLLVKYRMGGVNFGNTSTSYATMRERIAPADRRMYDAFTGNPKIGGGLSGRPLKEYSLRLCTIARETLDTLKTDREFHIVRTGGIETGTDVRDSLQVASLCQWYTGFYAALRKHGDKVYENTYKDVGDGHRKSTGPAQ